MAETEVFPFFSSTRRGYCFEDDYNTDLPLAASCCASPPKKPALQIWGDRILLVASAGTYNQHSDVRTPHSWLTDEGIHSDLPRRVGGSCLLPNFRPTDCTLGWLGSRIYNSGTRFWELLEMIGTCLRKGLRWLELLDRKETFFGRGGRRRGNIAASDASLLFRTSSLALVGQRWYRPLVVLQSARSCSF